jgi:hypothetical protein
VNELSAKERDNSQRNTHLDFKIIHKECSEFYKDYTAFVKFTEKNKERFFTDNLKVFSRYLYLAESLGNNDLMDMKVNYTLLGVSYEFLLKICALKINWDEYLETYKADSKEKSNSGNRKFEYVKQYVSKDLKIKLTRKQYKRSQEIINFVQLQRNHFAHSPFKGKDHYAVTKQIYEFMAVLVVLYKLKLPKEAVEIIKGNITKHKVLSGMDFEDVGFKQYIQNLDNFAIDVPLFPDW